MCPKCDQVDQLLFMAGKERPKISYNVPGSCQICGVAINLCNDCVAIEGYAGTVVTLFKGMHPDE